LRSIIVKSLEGGIALFNRRQFFEAHEVWEDGWRIADGGDRLLRHGLIQVAAGFHKLQCGQPGGCAALLSKGAEKLASVRSGGEDRLASRALLEAVEAWRETAVRMVETESTEYNAAALPVLPAPPTGHLAAAVYSQIEIDAPSHRVWDTLVDFDAYPDWNPFIRKIGGAARPGGRLSVAIRPPGRRPMTFRPLVLRAQPHRELRWRGRLLLPALFDGEHIFSIAPLTAARVRFSQRERLSGLLVPLLRPTLLEATRRGFEEMNRALARRCALTVAGVRRI